ncbi:helix-turn-helix domain-containing protein [Streptomyces sp. NPDC002209]|uniref:helix-turn-helix domain-containing protein n=1 Tax=Streptomyces sp. NPDC002209 TaxID=3364638 RepID=UPI003676A3DA
MLSNASAGASSQGAGEGRAGGPYFLTVAEVASIMKISNRAVYQLVHNGHLPALRVREEYRVSTDAVQEYLRETEAQLISLPKAPFRLRVMPPSRHGSRSAPGSS